MRERQLKITAVFSLTLKVAVVSFAHKYILP